MSGMEPMAIAALGAGGGALMDKKNPLRGAALGGLGGYFLSPAIAGAGGGVAPVVSGETAAAGGAAGMPKGMDMARMGMQMAGSSRPQPQGGGMAAPMPMPQQQQPAGSFMASSPYSNPQDPYTAMMMRRYGQG